MSQYRDNRSRLTITQRAARILSHKPSLEAFMDSQQKKHNKIDGFSTSQSLILFIGFITFITGVFLIAYSFFAWLLLASIKQALFAFIIGLLACFIGRKVIRKMSKKQYMVNLAK